MDNNNEKPRKAVNKSALRWMSESAGTAKLGVFALTVIQALLSIMSVLYAAIFREVIDSAAEGESTGFYRAILLLAALVCAQLAVAAVGNILLERTRAAMENRFKSRLFDTLMRKKYSSVTAVHSGEWVNRLSTDTATSAEGLCDIIPGVTGMAVKLVGALTMIMLLEPYFGLMLIPFGLVMPLISLVLRKKLKRLHKAVRESDGRLRVFLQENLASLVTVRTFAAEGQTLGEGVKRMAEHRNERLRKNRFSVLCSSGLGVVMNGAYLLGLFYCCVGMIHNAVSYGTLMAILQLISRIQSPFANISGYLPRYYAMTASAERLMEAEAFDEDCGGELRTAVEVKELYDRRLTAISLENAGFSYHCESEGGKRGVTLNGLDICVKKGEFAAFTGPSGSGKSTVLKLLMCLYDLDSGSRSIVCGEERLPLEPEWRRLFAYVPQGNLLMRGSVRETVAFADRTAMYDDERLQRALKIACAEEFTAELENGVDTVLGERGAGLSEGQAQRLAIARAIFCDAPILMLDECTSALDEQTERRLLANLRQMTDKTVFIVTHRPAALEICDKVIAIGAVDAGS